MRRFKDKHKAGRSKIAPFIDGESEQDRHSRRKAIAENWEDTLRAFCDERGLSLAICNNMHHWIFIRVAPYAMFIVEWWPSSAKLVVQRKYENGIHTHDAVQAMTIIVAALNKWERSNFPMPIRTVVAESEPVAMPESVVAKPVVESVSFFDRVRKRLGFGIVP